MELALWEILLVAGGLSLDVFAYCLWKGAMLSEMNRRNITKMVALFTACQMGAMLLGNGITLIPALGVSSQTVRAMHIAPPRYLDCETIDVCLHSFPSPHRRLRVRGR